MKLILAIAATLAMIFLSACSTSPATGDADAGPDAIASVADVDVASIEKEIVGLGPVDYNEARATCEKRVRTGTRIPREICRASGFNGMFPSGGLNMGTALESQPGYGPNTQ